MRSVEEILIQEAGVSAELVAKAKERLKDGKDLGDALCDLGALDAATWARLLASYYGLPFSDEVDLAEDAADLLDRVPLSFAKQYQPLPIARQADAVTVAVANPGEWVSSLQDSQTRAAPGGWVRRSTSSGPRAQ